jgi:predicted nucleic acid-binding protein
LILLDTSAVLTLLWGEPGEHQVAALLRGGDCAVPAPCLSEVVDRLIRRGGNPPSTLVEKLAPLLDEIVAVPTADTTIAWGAGELRARHYDRGSADLSIVDCVLLATARDHDKIATSDGALTRVARSIGIDVIPLPDSNGNRPTAN